MEQLCFRGGLVVLPDRVIQADLLVMDGRITGLGFGGAAFAENINTVDVSNKILLPGLIDTHVHMWEPSPLDYREDWAHGTRAAAAGGITTVCDMPLSVPPVTDAKGFQLKLDTASKAAVVDFAFWGGLTPQCIEQMSEMNRLGCIAYKGFMSYANPDYPQITDGYLVQGMRAAQAFDGLIGVHAENAEIAHMGSLSMVSRQETDPAMHDDARPWWTELEAIQRAVLFARATSAKLYICHMTIPEGAAFLKQAKAERAQVWVETCPHYLLFDKSVLREKGAFAKCNPPMRSRERVEELWSYIFDGTIDTIGSDHGPYTDDEKTKEGNFFKEYCGFGGYDAMLPALITHGVHQRKLPYEKLAALTSGNAARIMGLYPQKGSLLPGADADIVVVDPQAEWVFDGEKSFSKTHTSHHLYHGMAMRGRVEATYVRGKMVYNGQSITAPDGWGRYVPRQP